MELDFSDFFATLRSIKRVLVIGIGGGGDVAGTIPTANFLRGIGVSEVLHGSLIWERVDVGGPPAPIPHSELKNIEIVNDTIAIVNKNSRTKSGLDFEAARFALALDKNVITVDITKGVVGIIKGLNDFCRKKDIQLVIGIDVGGDILTQGHEPGLISPMADNMLLSALANIDIPTIIGIMGPGSDGEISQDTIMRYMGILARNGGYLGAIGITKKDIEDYEKVLKHMKTSSSRVSKLAAEGAEQSTVNAIKRDVKVSLLNSITFFFDTNTVYNYSPFAKLLTETKSIDDANKIFNNHGIKTELDRAIEIYEKIQQLKK